MATAPQQSGAFIPTSFIFDISQIYSTDSDTPEFKEIIVRLYQYLNAIALSTNIREAGQYPLQEFVNGQLWFPNPLLNSSSTTTPTQRQVFRTVINFGMLPNARPMRQPHNINPNMGFTFTRIYATASDPVGFNYIPIPFADPLALANNISLTVDATYVNITTGSNRSNFTICYVILEYIKF